ncbi:hypothetical protein C5O27_01105 [Gordonia alkanivorans]|uniref:hypothetical protein n=1 Tax=Gordonia alkanivorans TaxID=84096 RepID=UPI000FDE3099|nr:hypothetical protein [Gordonia alkanivorans]AZZ79865.1 hypothetical protein C5O27_01105 [Gordonia alkanivorans]
MTDRPPAPRRAPDTPLTLRGRQLSATLGDFWSWSASDLLSNSLRGQLAEYIVGFALDCLRADESRREWDAFDLVTPNGVRVEVKSTAHLQSWGPTTPNSLGFSIAERYAWDARTNTSSNARLRSADIYVFCVHTATDPVVADPLELDQWDFFVLPTATLNEIMPGQKRVALNALRVRTGAVRCGFDELSAAVDRVQETGRPFGAAASDLA